jgi:phosphoribosylamine---glycine ligase
VKVLVVGGGGREHALSWALTRSPSVDEVVAAPGNAGMAASARCMPVAADDVAGQLALAEDEAVDLVVVGPEGPLVAGLVDALAHRGITAFGPTADGARIEGSKAWAKDLCRRSGVPTGRAEVADHVAAAIPLLDAFDPPYVVKADGLAGGKGVAVAPTRAEAIRAIEACLVDRAFGPAGNRVVVEEHLAGEEVSILALTDGRTVIPLEPAQDFKRVGDADTGPNTGGMGAHSPVPAVTPAMRNRIVEEVMEPTVRALAAEGIRYRGVLYAGLMLTGDGPKVLEFNARFGDPEVEAILPRIDADLGEVLLACADGRLQEARVAWSREACVTVVLASAGYPGEPATGRPVRGLDRAGKVDKTVVFHAGTALRDGTVVSAGGRVLAVSALGKDLTEARERAYESVSLISFEGMHHRTDIAEEAAGGS